MNKKSLRANRAAQFAPFDSLKGLHEELRAREEKLARCEMKELSEEEALHLSEVMQQVVKGTLVEVEYFSGGRYEIIEGKVREKNIPIKVIVIGNRKIPFSLIREMNIVG